MSISMENQLKCDYLDLSSQNSHNMLRNCVQDQNSSYDFNCKDLPKKKDDLKKNTARTNNISIQRGMTDNFIEGFTNNNIFITDEGPGKSSIPENECPEGFSRCQKTGRCIQKCRGCIYRDNMKSQQYNEGDPCFPEGTYNGVTNEGYIQCTCGSSGQYCSNNFMNNLFTTDGMMISKKNIVTNVGQIKDIDSLFNIDYL